MVPTRRLDDYDTAAPRCDALWVVVPPEHQGVVNALRAAYPADRAGLPLDMARLLDRLA